MVNRHIITLALGMLAMLPSACRDGLAPGDVAGAYVLDRVGGAPLPAEVYRDVRGVVQVLADTLRLDADGRGRFTSVRVIQVGGASPPPDVASVLESDLVFRIVGSRIDIDFICPDGAQCSAGPHLVAHRHDGGLLVGVSMVADAPLRYRRVM